MSPVPLPRVSMNPPPLESHVYVNSLAGLYSLTTLIVGATTAVLIDPPQATADAEGILNWNKLKTVHPITAIFSSHHHPDHYWSADVILKEYPRAKFFATPHTCSEIRKDFEEKKAFMGAWYGDDILANPRLPEPYPCSFFVLPGNLSQPVILLGPLQGDTVNCTMFWMPGEGTVITGDVIFGRNTHVWYAAMPSKSLSGHLYLFP
jgi:glyoxylase-like metal-dependent hydrolase (beta-lactamase superfamily II)